MAVYKYSARMDRKLIVQVRRLRDEGWVLPRHRLAFGLLPEGIFSLREEMVPMLNRHARVARLLDADTGKPEDNPPALYDAVVLRATADEWIVSGLERVLSGLQEVDVAQTWQVALLRIETPST